MKGHILSKSKRFIQSEQIMFDCIYSAGWQANPYCCLIDYFFIGAQHKKNFVSLVRQTPRIGLCCQSIILQPHTKNVGICTFTRSLLWP